MSILDKFLNIKKKNDIITLFEKYGHKNASLTKIIETSYESNVDAYSVIKKIVDVYAGSKLMNN